MISITLRRLLMSILYSVTKINFKNIHMIQKILAVNQATDKRTKKRKNSVRDKIISQESIILTNKK